MTQLQSARAGKITPQMEKVAQDEDLTPKHIKELIQTGKAIVPINQPHWNYLINNPSLAQTYHLCGIGAGLKTKVNANIGTSSDYCDVQEELHKLKVAESAGTDTVMDLSTSGDIPGIRQHLIKESTVPFGTVPIYEAVIQNNGQEYSGNQARPRVNIAEMTEDTILKVIESQAKDGVDFITLHCGVTRDVLKRLTEQPRVGGIVSRGGAILAKWMELNQKENPFYTKFDKILEIARTYDVTLSLGDGLRPGALADAFDQAQIAELMVLANLARRARVADVQVMIEGPGHVPMNQIQSQVQLQKQLCNDAPFYVLGPLVTDSAPGYDHITSAIGAAIAAWAGADFICYVTPAEHLGLPNVEHVKEGIIAARIAAHAADIAKGIKSAWQQDKQFSEYRRKRDWSKQIALAIDPTRAKEYRQMRQSKSQDVCSMCSDICVYRLQPN
ncbi:phosphomethylpyrimidine synthase ThiC [Planctomycetota bacterium]